MILAQDGLLIIQLKTHLHEVESRKKKTRVWTYTHTGRDASRMSGIFLGKIPKNVE